MSDIGQNISLYIDKDIYINININIYKSVCFFHLFLKSEGIWTFYSWGGGGVSHDGNVTAETFQ